MKNKVLINLYVPTIDSNYEIYIPVNESVKKVLELIVKSVVELSDGAFDLRVSHFLMDPDVGFLYNDAQIIRDTNIKNSKKVILV
jgi:hypothetical protein